MQQFLAQVAGTALEGSDAASGGVESCRALVPLHARSFLEGLARRAFDEARFIVGNLQSLIAKPAEITRARRAASLAFVPAIAFLLAALLVAMLDFARIHWERAWGAAYPGQPSLRIAAEIFRDESESLKEGNGDPKELELVGAYIATHFGSVITNESFWLSKPKLRLEPDSRAALNEAIAKYSASDAATVARAEREMSRRLARREQAQRSGFVWIGAGMVLVVGAVAALVDLVGALGFRVLPVLRLFGFSVVNRSGALASRGRLFVRWILVWVPSLAAIVAMTEIAKAITNRETSLPVGTELGILFILMAALDAVVIYAALRPNAGLQDRLAGTRLVPM
jgi:hypothetical protein